MYNLVPGDHNKYRRRISIKSIASLSQSAFSNEFAIHVENEYDYRFISKKRDEIFNILQIVVHNMQGKQLKICKLNTEKLDQVIVNRKGMHLREQVMLRRKNLFAEPRDSDEEDEKMCQPSKSLDLDLLHDTNSDVLDLSNLNLNVDGNNDRKVNLSDFSFLKVIGRGAFGKVMLVKLNSDNSVYAMKILKKAVIKKKNQIEHTKAERNILASLKHPFCMQLKYAFQTQSKLYFVLDFYKGGELFYHLRLKRRFSEAQAKIIIAEVAMALGHLHSLGILYRDLKPENILMDLSGHVCITDFGLSKQLDNSDFTKTYCGTPEYMAPELILQKPHGFMVDWWTLGVLTYELVTGHPPVYHTNQLTMYKMILNKPLVIPNHISNQAKRFLVQLLQKDATKRLGSKGDFDQIKKHPWFDGIDWKKLYHKQIEPLYKPKNPTKQFDATINNNGQSKKPMQNVKPAHVEAMVGNFDAEFTDQPVRESHAQDVELPFADFTFQTDKILDE